MRRLSDADSPGTEGCDGAYPVGNGVAEHIEARVERGGCGEDGFVRRNGSYRRRTAMSLEDAEADALDDGRTRSRIEGNRAFFPATRPCDDGSVVEFGEPVSGLRSEVERSRHAVDAESGAKLHVDGIVGEDAQTGAHGGVGERALAGPAGAGQDEACSSACDGGGVYGLAVEACEEEECERVDRIADGSLIVEGVGGEGDIGGHAERAGAASDASWLSDREAGSGSRLDDDRSRCASGGGAMRESDADARSGIVGVDGRADLSPWAVSAIDGLAQDVRIDVEVNGHAEDREYERRWARRVAGDCMVTVHGLGKGLVRALRASGSSAGPWLVAVLPTRLSRVYSSRSGRKLRTAGRVRAARANDPSRGTP